MIKPILSVYFLMDDLGGPSRLFTEEGLPIGLIGDLIETPDMGFLRLSERRWMMNGELHIYLTKHPTPTHSQ